MDISLEEYSLTSLWCMEGRTVFKVSPTSRLTFETFQVRDSVVTNVK